MPLLGDGLPLLTDAGRLAAQVTHIVELGPADVAARDDNDLLDDRAVNGEGPLDADAVADLADRERLTCATTLAAQHEALEHLDAGPVAFDDADVHLQGVTRTEVGHVGAQSGLLDLLDQRVHDSGS